MTYQSLKHLSGLVVNLDGFNVKSRDLEINVLVLVVKCVKCVAYLRDVVVSSLSLLLLQLDGNASDRSNLNTLHQMSNESNNTKLS